MTPDTELLLHFSRTNSEDAFTELVKRHIDLVYSAALRQVHGDEHLARDVAQSVFSDLARKAGSLLGHENLAGWLYTSAHHAAAKMVRGEMRRRDREEKFMREPKPETAPDADWETIRPALDEAMHQLKTADRDALLLRYFENQPFAEVGARLGLNENAARMRVERALEKLRGVLAQRGLTTTAAFATVLSAHAVQTAPTHLALALSTVSVTTATNSLTLMKLLSAAKLKLGLGLILATGATTALLAQHQAEEKLQLQKVALQQQLDQLQSQKDTLSQQLAELNQQTAKLSDDQNELLKLRGEVGVLRQQSNDLQRLKDENHQLTEQLEKSQTLAPPQPASQAISQAMKLQALDDARSYVLNFILYAGDHSGQLPTSWDQIAAYSKQSPNSGTNIIFEILNQTPVNLNKIGTNVSSYILVKSPVLQEDDGRQAKAYGYADGHAEIKLEPAEGFEAFEQEHSIPPQN